ncbi:hypothetical protein KAW18_09330, partial [candidate division WOR-3 bacterium]|nr:hypothetical protein [candidate division WOR-3 bacterium]
VRGVRGVEKKSKVRSRETRQKDKVYLVPKRIATGKSLLQSGKIYLAPTSISNREETVAKN